MRNLKDPTTHLNSSLSPSCDPTCLPVSHPREASHDRRPSYFPALHCHFPLIMPGLRRSPLRASLHNRVLPCAGPGTAQPPRLPRRCARRTASTCDASLPRFAEHNSALARPLPRRPPRRRSRICVTGTTQQHRASPADAATSTTRCATSWRTFPPMCSTPSKCQVQAWVVDQTHGVPPNAPRLSNAIQPPRLRSNRPA